MAQKTRVFHGGKFHEVASGKSKAVAEAEKKKIKHSGHPARVTSETLRNRQKVYSVWKK